MPFKEKYNSLDSTSNKNVETRRNMAHKDSETITEGIFRDFYGATTFIEKSAIPKEYGFKSKKDINEDGYPDFFYETEKYAIVVEVKATLKQYKTACIEAKFYARINTLKKDVFAISMAGQTVEEYKAGLYYIIDGDKIKEYETDGKLLSLADVSKIYKKIKYSDKISNEALKKKLKSLNDRFQEYQIKDTERSLFFSGLMIALKDENFIGSYELVKEPNESQQRAVSHKLISAHYLNEKILESIVSQINDKANSHSKEFHWKDRFSFIKNIDIPLSEYKSIIKDIENNIFIPFQEDEKQDILSRAYKIFLSRAGKIDNKNIILTPDHIKQLMIDLARLDVTDKVLDTCTGSGGFLMEALEQLVGLAKGNGKTIDEIINKQLIGVESDPTLFALACSNMFLHNDGRSNLIFGSSLSADNNKEVIEYIRSLKPNKCIINPPYEKNLPILFVKQAIDFLDSNGRLVVIMPTTTLNKNIGKDTNEILKLARLDFVIKMPEHLFSEQGRTVNTSIFGFTKTRHRASDKVIFYNMQDDGLVSVQHKGRVDKYGKWDGIKNAVIERIVNNNPDVGNYEMRSIYKGEELNCYGYKTNHRPNVNLVPFGKLFDTKTKGSLASDDAEPGEYPFITASEEWKTHNTYDLDKEAIVYAVAASGSLGRCHYVNGKFIASNLCLVLTPKNPQKYPINMLFYSVFLNSVRQRVRNEIADGTSKLTISVEDLDNYLIEYIPIETQNQIADEYKKKVLSIKNQLNTAEKEIENKIINL